MSVSTASLRGVMRLACEEGAIAQGQIKEVETLLRGKDNRSRKLQSAPRGFLRARLRLPAVLNEKVRPHDEEDRDANGEQDHQISHGWHLPCR
jgi:hypothetical protein